MTTPREMTVHGVLLRVAGMGVLLRGAAGSGKTQLALRMMLQYHAQLISDDAVCLQVRDGRLYGSAPRQIAAQMAVRGLGVVAIDTLCGPQAVCADTEVTLVVTLHEAQPGDIAQNTTIPFAAEALLGVQVMGMPLAIWPGSYAEDRLLLAVRSLQRKLAAQTAADGDESEDT